MNHYQNSTTPGRSETITALEMSAIYEPLPELTPPQRTTKRDLLCLMSAIYEPLPELTRFRS